MRAGACGYLLKRCTPAELVSAVREARMGGVPMPREIARKVIASFQQASVVAFNYAFAVIGTVFLACLPLVLLIRRGRVGSEAGTLME